MTNLIYRVFLIFIVFNLLSCSTNIKTKSVSAASELIESPKHIFIDLSYFKDFHVAMNSIGYDGEELEGLFGDGFDGGLEQIDRVGSETGVMTPGIHYAGVGVSALTSIAFVYAMKTYQINKYQRKLDEPVKDLLNKMEAINWMPVIAKAVDRNHGVSIFFKKSNYETNENVMRITPFLDITSNLLSLELHAYVEILSVKNKPIYKKYFHIQSPPLIDIEQNKTLADLNSIDKEQIKKITIFLFENLLPLIFSDLNSNDATTSIQNIRFNNHMGNYFERGQLLDINSEQNYIKFKTLRGHVKYYPIGSMN
ncbi:hypothetical protein SAMN05216326_1623 [Nitrosomonas marina]|uniref:Uncharacterized protein n=1 Tax=Nitrosomonas marina TaxID=917 RepID=A0A1I0GC50_9PROT|nr:hypothetical protein [Nitrosomonas marina]SET68352.1 hypothetical protein SAMN05216326_1623 [Nitrosomonas marina]